MKLPTHSVQARPERRIDHPLELNVDEYVQHAVVVAQPVQPIGGPSYANLLRDAE